MPSRISPFLFSSYSVSNYVRNGIVKKRRLIFGCCVIFGVDGFMVDLIHAVFVGP